MTQTPEERAAAKAAKESEKTRRAGLTQEERDAEDKAAADKKAADDAAAAQAKADAAAPKVKPTSAVVSSETGGHIRTYSQEVHGDEFHDKAKEFVAHTPGATVTLA